MKADILSGIQREHSGCFSINKKGVECGWDFWIRGIAPPCLLGVKSRGCGWRTNTGDTANSVTQISDQMLKDAVIK